MGCSIILVETRSIVRLGLKKLFTSIPLVDNVYEAATNEDLQISLSSHLIDLVLIHQSLIGDFLSSIQSQFLIITDRLDKRMLLLARDRGASGYILEDSVEGFLQSIVRLVEKREKRSFLLDPSLALEVLSSIDEEVFLCEDVNVLTPRQSEIYCLLHEGLDDRAIAKQLGIVEATVRSHVANILDKLQVTRHQIKQLPLPDGRYIRKRRRPLKSRGKRK
jgi:two-component system nitrate/nitrite response regulator NarL